MYPKEFPTATEHDYSDMDEYGYYACQTCGHTVKIKRDGTCIGVPIYPDWNDLPEGIATKTTLYKEHGLKLAPDQQPVGAKKQYNHRGKATGGYYPLYAIADAVPKRKATPEQLAALEKARHMAEKLTVVCSNCGNPEAGRYDYIKVTRKQWIEKDYDNYLCEHCHGKLRSTENANKWLADPHCVIIDTETTRINDPEIVEIAIIDMKGNLLLDTRIKPHHPEHIFEESENGVSAYDIHEIHPDSLYNAPTLKDMYPKLKQLLTGKTVLVYNQDFDIPMLKRLIQSEGLDEIQFKSDCVMLEYARWCGDWSDYWRSYRWQPLHGGDHSALGDCKATLKVIQEMAKYAAKVVDNG